MTLLKVYEVRQVPTGYRDDDRAFVAALNPAQAKYLAKSTSQCKFDGYEYEDLRAIRYPYEGEEELLESIDKPQWLFDNETYEDTLDEERRWFDSQCLM